MKYQHECIVCIVNAGYSDEVMEAARAFGATGGTVIHAHGTANRESEQFFHAVTSTVPAANFLQYLKRMLNAAKSIIIWIKFTCCFITHSSVDCRYTAVNPPTIPAGM